MPALVTLTLNPALDLGCAVEHLEPAVKLRCGPERVDPGGGGLNAARAIHALGGEALAVHCAGGLTGRRLQALLDAEGVAQRVVAIHGETRQSFAVSERRSGEQYRFVLPGPRLSGDEWRAALEVAAAEVAPGGLVLASGSLPQGVPHDAYARLARRVADAGARLVVDCHGPALEQALRAGVYMIKPNWREFDALFERAASSDEERAERAVGLVRDDAAEIVVVTLGARGTLLTTATDQRLISAPPVEVVSAVGGGDAFAGACLLALARGWPIEEACRHGVAAAAAAVATPGTAPPLRDEVERLLPLVADEAVGIAG